MIKKILALIEADIKTFLRNWKSLLIIVVFPLLLITLIFLSFSTEGLAKMPIGVVLQTNELGQDVIQKDLNVFFITSFYDNLDSCMVAQKNYKIYACVDVVKRDAFLLNVYYDNTREPIIWDVVSRIKIVVETLQKQQTRSIAYEFLGSVDENLNTVDSFRNDLVNLKTTYVDYVDEIESSKNTIDKKFNSINVYAYDSQDYITKTEEKINDAEDFIDNLDTYKEKADQIEDYAYLGNYNNLTGSERSYLNNIDNGANFVSSGIDTTQRNLDSKLGIARTSLTNAGRKIDDLVSNSRTSSILTLTRVINNMKNQESKFDDSIETVDLIKEKLIEIKDVDPEILVNPIVLRNIPTYIPSEDTIGSGDSSAISKEDAAKGFNLIGLQTIFPKILILIILFLSLLLSSFIALSNINSKTTIRLKIIKGLKIPHFVSLYVSSLITILIPLLIILLVGNFLFRLPFFSRFPLVFSAILIICSIFIFLGIFLSYLIKKESVTLLVNTFILIALIFFSGFLLPIESMSRIAGLFAKNFPGTVGLNIINKILFYNVGFFNLSSEFILILFWLVTFLIATILVKLFLDK